MLNAMHQVIVCNFHLNNYGGRHLNGSAQLWGKVANAGNSRSHVFLRIFFGDLTINVLGELRCVT